jgi:NitT/TauT family transport system substrate-binding protein
MKKIFLVALSLLLVIGLVGCNKNKKIKIKLAEVAHSVFYAPQYVALTNGYFEEEGLEVTYVNVNGADKVMAALLSRDCQIGLMGPEASLYVYLNGEADYAINFCQLTQRDGSFIVGREPIENFTLDMLKGKSILGGREGGMPEMTLEYVLKNAGLTIARNSNDADVNVRTDVAFGSMAGSFIANQGDFTTLFEPTATQLQRDGLGYVLGAVGSYSGEVPFTAYSTTKSYFEKNQDVLEKFTRAIYKAQQYVLNASDELVAEAMKPHFADISDVDLLAVVRSYRAIEAWRPNPYFGEEGYNRLMDIMELAGFLDSRPPYEKLVSNVIANKIINEK